MCRMLAKIAVTPFSPEHELLDAEHSLYQQSKCGAQPGDPSLCGPHASGCGIAWRAGTDVKTERRGSDDRWDEAFQSLIRGLETTAIIGHNRLSSARLRVDVSCSHPFLGRVAGEDFAFCHNGDVKTLMTEAKQRNVSDSIIFCERLAAELPKLEAPALAEWIKIKRREWSYTSLTALLLSPSKLFAWRCYSDEDPATKDRFGRYYTLNLSRGADTACIASEPVDSGNWELIPNFTLIELSVTHGKLSVEKLGL